MLTGVQALPPPAAVTFAVMPPAIPVMVMTVPAMVMMPMPTFMGRDRRRNDGAAEDERKSQGTAYE
jgi:hypothetical protein